MNSYYSNNAVTLLNAEKSLSIMKFKTLKFTCILSASQPVSLPQDMVALDMYIAPEFLHSKSNHMGFMKLLF